MPELQPLLQNAALLKVVTLLKNAGKAVILGHCRPDGDAIGAALGWAEYLRHLGKQVSIVMPDPEADFLKWMPGAQHILHFSDYEQKIRARKAIAAADLLCLLDFSQTHRLNDEGLIELVKMSKAQKLMIDHHLDPDTSSADFTISRPEASSTCELVFRLIYTLGGYDHLSRSGACCLYCGLMTDTGSFAYNSNDPDLYLIVSLLMRKGIDKERIYRNIYHCFSTNRLKFWGFLLNERLQFYKSGKAAIIAYSSSDMEAYKYKRGDAEGFVNEPLKVRGCRLSISLREDTVVQDKIHVSLRSIEDVPCNLIAQRFFNGGGHLNASGGELRCSLAEAVKTAEQAIEAFSEQLGL